MYLWKIWVGGLVLVLAAQYVCAAGYRQASASTAAARGDWERAVDIYSEGIKVNPFDGASYVGRGDAYAHEGRLDLAIADYSHAIRLDGRDTTAYDHRGLAYANLTDDIQWATILHQTNLDLAVADFSKAIDIEPRAASPYLHRGLAYREQNRNRAAIRDFQTYLAIAPQAADRPLVEQWIANLVADEQTDASA
jgi:tetratricopeptide (TPR) repeat protein